MDTAHITRLLEIINFHSGKINGSITDAGHAKLAAEASARLQVELQLIAADAETKLKSELIKLEAELSGQNTTLHH